MTSERKRDDVDTEKNGKQVLGEESLNTTGCKTALVGEYKISAWTQQRVMLAQ